MSVTSSFGIWSGGGCELAEGTRWTGDRLVFTDILSGTVLAAPADVPGAAAPVAGQPGSWIAAAFRLA